MLIFNSEINNAQFLVLQFHCSIDMFLQTTIYLHYKTDFFALLFMKKSKVCISFYGLYDLILYNDEKFTVVVGGVIHQFYGPTSMW